MPRFDGTGPFGRGPFRQCNGGQGRGTCATAQQAMEEDFGPMRGAGRERGRGRCGKGAGRGFGGQGCVQRSDAVSAARSPEDEIALIEQHIIALQTQLATLKERT